MDALHRQKILDQFSKQAIPFASSPSIRDEATLDQIVCMTQAGPDDNVLDVACGPGLLVCAFARVVRHATGIDLTPAMLRQARREQKQRGLRNVTWQKGDVLPLPYGDAEFSIVSSRFAFHHLTDPLGVLKEMRRVCKPGGRIAVADGAPGLDKVSALNMVERLRDPSHVRLMPLEELTELFAQAGLPKPEVERYRLEGRLDFLLERSFPANKEDADCIRRIFEDSLTNDALDMATESRDGNIFFGYPVAILVSTVP
jgi:SAM-dependent methyltransferase